MKIKYNAPTVLTFALVSALVLLCSGLFGTRFAAWFVASGRSGFDAGQLRCWFALFSHVLGHANWSHFFGNFVLILLIGPILEESYGSRRMLTMIATTALATGALNALLFSSGLMGASGIVFMMILLASFTNFSRGEIPLTFLLVLTIYLGREIVHSVQANDISEFAHLVGGFCGSLFGFFRRGRLFR